MNRPAWLGPAAYCSLLGLTAGAAWFTDSLLALRGWYTVMCALCAAWYLLWRSARHALALLRAVMHRKNAVCKSAVTRDGQVTRATYWLN